ncbi:MAG: phosphatase PAP2 family protein [Sedimentisphaerales bacterium]|nr:phosphatase PAP2 family protein [Sedimentisphaerales bacterium]
MNNNYSASLAVFFCAVLFTASVYADPAQDKSPAASPPPAAKTSNPKNLKRTPKKGLDDISGTSAYILELAEADAENWPRRIISDTKESFLRPDNLSLLLLAGGASVALHSSGADDKIADNFRDHHSFRGFTDEGLNVAGHPWTHIGAVALWYASSRKNQDDFNAERAKAMLAALSVTGVTTLGLKAIRDNDSPNGKNWAWPSGHAASSFTVAAMLDEFYGPNVGIPAYAFASLVSYRMLDTGDHWASDIVFGATLGWVVGHTFGEKQKQLELAGFKVLPYSANYRRGSVLGVNLIKRF